MKKKVCSACGAKTDGSAFVSMDGSRRYFCHPYESVGSTCYTTSLREMSDHVDRWFDWLNEDD